MRSTINIDTRHAYKKSSSYAILKTFTDDLKLLPIGPRTEQAYFACVRQLSEHYDRSPELISFEEVRQYCIDLKTVKRPWPHELELVRANPEFKLPVVLSAKEVRDILSKVENLDHRLEQGENLRQIQVNLGHKNPAITALYAHLTSLCKTQHQKRIDGFMSDL